MTAIALHTSTGAWSGLRAWRRRRPLIGGILLVLSGVEMFFSGQLDLGNIHVQLGSEGFQATVIPALLAVLGLLVIVTPAQRMFYGIFALILAVYSIVGVNLGGFVIGMLLGAVGGVLTVAWRPKQTAAAAASEPAEVASSTAPAVVESVAVEAPDSDRPGVHTGTVHAEAVDFQMLRDRARAAAGTSSAAAEPRPFAGRRS